MGRSPVAIRDGMEESPRVINFKTRLATLTTLAGWWTLGMGSLFADPYEDYLKGSEDFRAVKQEKIWAYEAFPSWIHMPWTYQWTIGYTAESGKWSVDHGYNGAFIDRDAIGTEDSPSGRLDWINRFKLRFYVDHSADKGLLHLWDGNRVKPHLDDLHGTGIRAVPLNEATEEKLRGHLRKNIAAVKSSPYRAAYALDDEPSWGHFVHPTMWQVTDDADAYPKWLREIYGPDAPKRDGWVSYDAIQPQLGRWSIADFDASPLMDQWTFNDSHWCNLLGRLVEYSNELDTRVPCGIVGGQSPSPFGGYDYARLMRKIQFIEAYNLGSSQSIIRSFNPRNALPAVTSMFHRSSADDVWQIWYYLAQGNRGHIGWVEGWFDGDKPAPWHAEVSPALLEAGGRIGPMMAGAEWQHDGVAIYYSHPSIQLGWVLDAEAHGKTWRNRNNDERLASSAHVRHAWENMLRDSGIQFSHLGYIDLVRTGVPADFRVLILPATLCVSDAEAARIKEFCQRGGTVIADYLPGLWDQHGKGRRSGALDDLFGVKHDSAMKAADVFGESLWVEVDQDANYSWKSYQDFLTRGNTCVTDVSGFHKAVRAMAVDQVHEFGQGKAVLMNLSPQLYNAYRVVGAESANKRNVFIKHLAPAGVTPRVRIENAGEPSHGYEITYWSQPKTNRILLFLIQNPEITGDSLGGGNSQGLKTATLPVVLEFRDEIKDLRDERSGKSLGNGTRFPVQWKQNEAVVLSFQFPERHHGQ